MSRRLVAKLPPEGMTHFNSFFNCLCAYDAEDDEAGSLSYRGREMECLSIMLNEGDTWLKELAQVLGEIAGDGCVQAALLPPSLPQTLSDAGSGDASDVSRDRERVSGKGAAGGQASVPARLDVKVNPSEGNSCLSRTRCGRTKRTSVSSGSNVTDSSCTADSSPQLESAMECKASSKAGAPCSKEGSSSDDARKYGAGKGSGVGPPGEAVAVTAREEGAFRTVVRAGCGGVQFAQLAGVFCAWN